MIQSPHSGSCPNFVIKAIKVDTMHYDIVRIDRYGDKQVQHLATNS